MTLRARGVPPRSSPTPANMFRVVGVAIIYGGCGVVLEVDLDAVRQCLVYREAFAER